MNRCVFFLAAMLLLAACTTNPIPEGYKGPLANVADSATVKSGSSADIFYLSKVQGKSIPDSVIATRQANHGRGMSMTPAVIKRDVPATAATFTLVGRSNYAAPIQELINPIYQVTGDIEFTPAQNGRYVVKGVLGESYSAVWLEDLQTGAVIGRKIEAKGSSKLGILEK